MAISPELEAKILDQLGEFGEVKAELRGVREDVADLKKSVGTLVARDQQSRGARTVIIAGIGAAGGFISTGALDLFMRLVGRH